MQELGCLGWSRFAIFGKPTPAVFTGVLGHKITFKEFAAVFQKTNILPLKEMDADMKNSNINRVWTTEEFGYIKTMCYTDTLWPEERLTFLYLGRYMGLRMEEVFKIDRVIAGEAVRNGCLYVKDRQVSANSCMREQLQKLINYNDRRTFLLVPRGHSPQMVRQEFLLFIAYHGKRIACNFYNGLLTFNGLRNTYATNLYHEIMLKGKSDSEAFHQVAALMGQGDDWYIQR